MDNFIDLRSDTVTKPSAEMRAAMAAAEVGDDVYGEDPTVNALQDRAAALLGKEAALFVPSGTMANLIAMLCLTRPGDSIILSEESHPFHYEGGNLARTAGLLAVPVPDPLGKITPAQVAARACQIDDPHFSHTTLLAIENTVNRGGGACYTVEEVAALAATARAHGMKVHCDGARLFNAAEAVGVPASALVAPCDTVCFCLSKGLGAPVGSLLVGPRGVISQALRHRKHLGGGMRQAGVLAAAGLHALRHHVSDLAADHHRTAILRAALSEAGYTFPIPSPTNILYIHAESPLALVAALVERGVLTLPHGERAIRAVLHRDISDADLSRAIDVFRAISGARIGR